MFATVPGAEWKDMAKHRKNATSSAADASPGSAEAPHAGPGRFRWLLTLLLLFHGLAVVTPPLNFATTGSGPARWVYDRIQPYVQLAYLDHGYFFFAPNPGASHLVRYRAEFDDDREPVEDMFPDQKKQWPRLLYHRHFMLTEHLHAAYVPPEPPADLESEEARQWRGSRALYESRWEGFVNHLRAKHDADRIEMHRVEHRPPDPLEFLEGTTLADPGLYQDLLETMPPENEESEESDSAQTADRADTADAPLQGPLGPAPWRPDLLTPQEGVRIPQPQRPLEDIGPGPATKAGQGEE